MAARALDFANAHPVADTSCAAVVKRLSDAVAQGDAMATQQSDGNTAEQAAVARRNDLRHSIRRNQLSRLVRIADLAAETHPELRGLIRMPPSKMPNKPFLIAARALLAAATANKDLLVSLGLGDNFIANLTQATDDLDAATSTAHNGRSDHVGARVDLLLLARDCTRDVEVLDTFYRETLPAGSDLLAAWASARNVAGPFHHQPVIPAPVPVPVPQPIPNTGSV